MKTIIGQNRNEIKRVKCKHCDLEREIKPKDVFTLLSKRKYYFRCFQCEGLTRIRSKDMTKNFKYWVKKYNYQN